MKDIKPKVAQDVTAIRDKFPCQQYVYDFMKQLVSAIFRSNVFEVSYGID